MDGRPPLPELIQESPRFGNVPTHATEVRVAYGERGPWVSFVCRGDPTWIRAPFFAREQQVTSDLAWSEVDPNVSP